MSIVALCPLCKEGKVRVPERAIGLNANCPRCLGSFVIAKPDDFAVTTRTTTTSPTAAHTPVVDKMVSEHETTKSTGEPRTYRAKPATLPVEQPSPEPVPEPKQTSKPRAAERSLKPVRTSVEVDADSSPTEVVGPSQTLRPGPAPTEADESSDSEPMLLLPLIALILGGLGLIIVQIPYCRIVTIALAILGLILALGSEYVIDRKKYLARLGVALNVAILLVVFLLPGWLNLDTWFAPVLPDESKLVKSIEHGTGKPIIGDWIDISKGSWQSHDIRISVISVTNGQIELPTRTPPKKFTKQKYLQIKLKVAHAGLDREIEFKGWSLDPATEGLVPKLTDSSGKSLVVQNPEKVAELFQTKLLLPSKSTEQTIYFDGITGHPEYFRLELPGNAFGAPEISAKFQIPHSAISELRSQPK